MKKMTPFKIIALYLLFSGTWILFSDLLLLKMAPTTSVYSALSIVKGWLYLVVSGSILYGLIHRYARERKEAEEGLRISEGKCKTLFNNTNDAILINDMQGHMLEANDAACERLDYTKEELLRMTPMDLDAPEYAVLVTQRIGQIRQNGSAIFQTAHVRRDGAVIPTEISSRIIEYEGREAILSVCRDITERRKTEEERDKLQVQLFQAQKMEAIGQISGGIAHDFNNILSAMMGYVTLIKMKSGEEDPANQYLDQLLSLTERAATLTKSLLAFSRKQILDIKPVSLNDAVSTIGKLLLRVIGEDIKLNLKLSDRDIVVNADRVQLEQALINLATNARDAMHEGGTLTISTGPLEMDEPFVKMHGFGKPGKYALLMVEDTGVGIDEEAREKIFEPFFTTKGAEKGTGLGLAMVYGTIKQHDGYINVYSEAGKGTTFKIYLPAIDTEADEAKTLDSIPRRGGTETILLVEDEGLLRQATRRMLEAFGYKVIEAEDGNDAVSKYAEHKAEIKLVFMDVIMPNKSGKEAYQEMRRMQPDIKVIFTSGHTGDILTSKKIAEEGLHFIAKPVLPKELFEKIRDVLDN